MTFIRKYNPLLKRGFQYLNDFVGKNYLLRSNLISSDKSIAIIPTENGLDLSVEKITYYKSLVFANGTNSNLEINKDMDVTQRTMAGNGSCCVCCFDKYILVGDFLQNGVAISKDYGETWSFITLGYPIRAVSFKNGVFVAFSNSGGKLFVSTDNLTSFQSYNIINQIYAYSFNNDAVFCALSYNSQVALISEDGLTWNSYNLPAYGRWSCGCVVENERLVVFRNDSNQSAYSDDNGKTWTATVLPQSLKWYHCIFDAGKIIAIATDNTNKGAISYDNGETWTAITLPSVQLWRYISKVGDSYLVVASNSSNAAISTDGVTWVTFSLGYTANWYVSVVVAYQETIKRFEDSILENSEIGVKSKVLYDNIKGYSAANILGLEYLFPFQNKYLITSKLVASPKIIFTGDSTNETGSLQADNTKATANAPYQLFSTKINREGIKATVIKSGVSGQTASYWRTSVLPSEIAQAPDCIIIKWGINDQSLGITSLTNTMNLALSSIRTALPKTAIILCSPNNITGPYNMTESWVKQVSDLYRSLARKYQCAFFDIYRFMMDINVDYSLDGFTDEYIDTFDVSSYGFTDHFAHIHPKFIWNAWQADIYFSMLYPDWVKQYASCRANNELTFSNTDLTLTGNHNNRGNVNYVQINVAITNPVAVFVDTLLVLPKPLTEVLVDNVKIDIDGKLYVKGGVSYSERISYPINQ